MSTIANIEARYSANIIQFDRELKRLQNLNKRATDKILNDNRSAARDVNQAWAKADIGGALNRSLGSGLGSLRTQLMSSIAAITSGAGIAAAVALADTYNRFTNSLKVAGVSGANLAVVQGRLFESANRNGVAVEMMGQVYGRLAQSSKELGASQEQILKATNAVSAAVRITGRPISEAQGAMLQFSQSIGAGTVRAEEFNSMMEGMLPLVQAAAGASSKYGGSVAKMREDVLKGKLSSKEFFDLILAGSAALEAQAARAPLTVAQSFEALKNKMIEAIGTTNETWGVTDRLSEALAWLGNNLDTVSTALGVIALAMAATLAPAVGKAAVAITTNTVAMVANGVAAVRAVPAQLAFAAALNGTTRSAAAATFGLRLLMSATGIGLAITAVSIALGVFAAQSYKAAEATRQMRERVREKAAALDEAEKAAAKARIETGTMTAEEMKALEATAKLTGRVDLLTSAYGRMALAAWEAARAAAAASLEQATSDRVTAQRDYIERRRINNQTESYVSTPYGTSRRIGGDGNAGAARTAQSEEAKVFRDSIRVENEARARVSAVIRDGMRPGGVETYQTRTTATGPTGGAKTGGGSDKGSGRSAAEIEKAGEEALAQAERQLRDAVRAQAVTASERHTVSLAALEDDKAMAVLAIEKRVKDGEITRAIGDQLIGIQAQIYDAQVSAETARRTEELAEAQRELLQLRNDNHLEAARLDAEELTDKARLATSMDERHAYERQALAAQQRADTLMFNAEQEALKLQLEKNGHTKAQIDQIIADRQATFNRRQAGQVSTQSAQQDQENGPGSLQEWITGFAQAEAGGQSFNQKLFDIAEGGIASITSGLTDAIMGAKSFGEAFGDMAKGVIAALIEMGIKFLIFEMLGRAFGVPGLGKAAIGLKPNGGFASGTDNVARGGIYEVGEKGKELVALPGGAQVLPNNLLRNAAKVPTGGGAVSQTVVNHIKVDAKDAVLSQQVHEWIYRGVTQGMTGVKTQIREEQMKAGRNRL